MAAEEDFNILKGIADRIFGDDEDDQKEKYVSEHMKRLGYRIRAVFEDPEPDNGGGGNDFTSDIFGGRRQRREVRDTRERRDRGSRGGSGFGMSQYG